MAIPEGFSNGVHTESSKLVEDVDLVIIGGEQSTEPKTLRCDACQF